MKGLKDIVIESLLDDEDEIMGVAYDKLANPFLTLIDLPSSTYLNDSKWEEVLKMLQKEVESDSKIIEDPAKANGVCKIAFSYDNMIKSARLYIKLGRATYMVMGHDYGEKKLPYISNLGQPWGKTHIENNPPTYIPSKKLAKYAEDFIKKLK